MNKIIKLITSIAVLASMLVSCNKNTSNNLSPEDIGIDIRLNGIVSVASETEMATKAEELQTEAEKTIKLLTIAVYDSNGQREWAREYEGGQASRYTVTGLSEGNKTVVVLANKKVNIPESLSDIGTMVSSLDDNARDGFVMFGKAAAKAEYNPEPTVVNISRLAAKFRLFGGIKTQWEIDAPEYFDILNIYVANAGGNLTLDGEDSGPNYNLRTTEVFTDNEAVRNLTVASKQNWTSGEVFNGGTSLYAYPNSNGKLRTAVIIKAKFNNRVCYYPMIIDQNIESNHMYNFGNIVITCEGSPNPWTDFEKVKINYSIEITDWITVPLDKDITF